MRAAQLALLSLSLLAAPPSARSQTPAPGTPLEPRNGGVPATGPGQPPQQLPGTAPQPPPAAPANAPAAPPPPPSAPPPALAEGLGRIAGKVTIAGLAPKLANIPVTKDMKICGTSKADEALEIGSGGGIRYVVLWVEGAAANAPAAKAAARPPKVKLDQTACQFIPHVIATTAGAELDVTNSDPVLHNVHAREGEATAFNYAMPIKGYVIPRKLQKTGTLRLSCDAHPWMHAIIHVLPTALSSVTDGQGAFYLDVPPGKYTLLLSHERLGQKREAVEVVAGQTLQHDVSLTPR
jgi:plastocyanin